jgi:hypothetical protein
MDAMSVMRAKSMPVSCIDVFVLTGLCRSVTIIIFHVLMALYLQDYIDPWLLLFFMYWCLCSGRTTSIRDYCYFSCIDVFVVAGLYCPLLLLFIMYWCLCTDRTISIRDYCNLSCIDVSVFAGLYRSVTFIIFKYWCFVLTWLRDYCNLSYIGVFVLTGLCQSVTIVIYHILVSLYWQD